MTAYPTQKPENRNIMLLSPVVQDIPPIRAMPMERMAGLAKWTILGPGNGKTLKLLTILSR